MRRHPWASAVQPMPALALATLALLAFVAPAQAKVVVGGFGSAGTEGGQFGAPGGVAINNSGNGAAAGTTYVVDSDQNRVQRSGPAGTFERAWGFDVETGGVVGFEICTVAVNCKAGAATPTTANGGQLNNPQGVAVDQSTGHVYVTEGGNRRVSEFDADGNFLRAWGWDVDTSAGTGFEVCVAAGSCKQGAAGSGAGQFGTTIGYPAIGSAGEVAVADQANNRVQVFSSSGAFMKLVGGDVVVDGAEGTGTLAPGSNVVSAVSTTSKFFEVGQTIASPDHPGEIQAGTTIVACAPNCSTPATLTLSQNTAASVTAGAQALRVAAGAGNVPGNEVQTISVGGGATGGGFNLAFNGQSTIVSGTAVFNGSQFNLTNVNTTAGSFEVGQGITGTGIPNGTKIVAVNLAAETLTLSQAVSSGVNATRPITGYAVQRGATAADLQVRLEALSTVGGGNVAVSGPDGGPWAVEFKGTRFGGADVPALTATAALAPSGSVSISSANPGTLEVCSAAADCRPAAAGTALGQFSGAGPNDLAFDSSDNLYALDPGNARVQRFGSSLATVAAFGGAALAPFTSAAPEHVTAAQGGTRLDFSVRAASFEVDVVELDTAGALKDSSLVGAGMFGTGAVPGIAADDGAGTVVLSTTTDQTTSRVLVLGSTPLPAPVLALDPIGGVTESGATLSGTVDPQGGIGVTCSYEYSTDQASWTSVEEAECGSLAPGGGAQPIGETVNGLAPGAHYFLRLAVTRVLDPGSLQRTPVRSFDTDAVPPAVSGLGVVDIADTSARLVGRIDPRNAASSYVFEYGATPALGSSTPPVSIGGGTNPVVISQPLTGLDPGTTYYYRLLATNASGSAATAEQSFTTRATPLPLPEGRAYELVSPPDKNATNIDAGNHARVTLAPDGDTVGFCSGAGFGDTPVNISGPFCGDYVSRRTASGWSTSGIRPFFCPADENAPGAELNAQTRLRMSPALDQAAFQLPEAESCLGSLVPGAPMPETNLYLESLLANPFSYDLLTPAFNFAPRYAENQAGSVFEGGSDDWGHLVYASTGAQAPGAAAPASGLNQLYDWHGGTIDLVSVNPSGNAFTTPSALAQDDGVGSISSTGDRIFFQNPASARKCGSATGCELYLREGGAATSWVSEQECTSGCADNEAADYFEWANRSGDRALFMTSAKLTDGAPANGAACKADLPLTPEGCNLYLYAQGPNPAVEKNLTLVSKDDEPADGVSPEVAGIIGGSEDGDIVYFAARGQLVSGGPVDDNFKGYRWRWNGGSPTVEYLGSLGSAGGISDFTTRNWLPAPDAAEGGRGGPMIRQVTADGSHLLVQTAAAILPAIDTDTAVDVYLWSEDGGWECISCQQPGTPSNGTSTFEPAKIGTGAILPTQNREQRQVMTEDGRKVFFAGKDALVPQDVNGTTDIYMWDEGAISLISPGTGSGESILIGIAGSGRDVVFATGERLVGWDTDTSTDYYDARVGGGFPEPPATGVPCEGDACRGPGPVAPPASGAGTAAFQGPGNPAPQQTKPKKKRHKQSKKHRRKSKHHKQSNKRGKGKAIRGNR